MCLQTISACAKSKAKKCPNLIIGKEGALESARRKTKTGRYHHYLGTQFNAFSEVKMVK